MRGAPLLTDAQWALIEPHLPPLPRSPWGGRPWADDRKVLEGLLWMLRSGARWQDLPSEFPSPTTCWRRLKMWEQDGTWTRLWRVFLSTLDAQGKLDWSETFLDASFAPAKKGATRSARPARGRGRSGWFSSTAMDFLWQTTWTPHLRRRFPSPK
jgi:transposase